MDIKSQIQEAEKELVKLDKQGEKIDKEKRKIKEKIWSIRMNVSMTIEQMVKLCSNLYSSDKKEEPYKSMVVFLHSVYPDDYRFDPKDGVDYNDEDINGSIVEDDGTVDLKTDEDDNSPFDE